MEEVRVLTENISEKVRMLKEKDEEIRALIEKYESKLKEQEIEDLKEIEELRNDCNVTQMLFDDFKEEMTYKYGYDSTAETTDEELVYGDNTNAENNECSLCGFKGKTAEGLKTHVRRKHRD